MPRTEAREKKTLIQVQLKLRPTKAQARQLNHWLWHLTGVYNWAIRKIELDAENGIYWSAYDLEGLTAGHSRRIGVPAHTIIATVRTAHNAWRRCFDRLAKRPRFKGSRNKLSSIPFIDRFAQPTNNRIAIPFIGSVRFHRQELPNAPLKGGRIIRRASGWYLCLFVDAPQAVIPRLAYSEVGIDPGFTSLLTLSTGEKIEHPQELRRTATRLGQAQRGWNRRLAARLLERQANQRKDRNHKLSRRLISENELIAWSDDSYRVLSRTFGKSVTGAALGQLRTMLASKCRSGGRQFVAVPSRYSTMTCSACGALSGPTGYAGLSVRRWRCGCGADHDRDCNAAMNTLVAARGMRVESHREVVSGTAS